MKSIVSVLSIIALGFGLLSCSGGGGGGGGSSASGFAVSTTAANFGVVGNVYTSTLVATGGTPPFTWTVSGGVLPTNLSIDPVTGVVSGTPDPAAVGNSTVVFTVTDSTGMTAFGSVLFAIHPRTDRVSVDNNGIAGISNSSTPSINGNGSLVAFVSASTNLVTGVNGTQIYVHNRQTNQIEVISRDNNTTTVNEGNGISSDPAISADGRFVAFVSQSTNLVAGVITAPQVYLRDRQTGQTTLVSLNSSGVTSNGLNNSAPGISSDGRFIVFVSNATNLVPGVNGQQVYLLDTQTGTTTLVSQDTGGTAGNGASSQPTISADGRFVALTSVAALAPTPGGSGSQVFIRDTTGTTTLVSQDTGGTAGNGASSQPTISADGRFVALTSVAALAPTPGGSGSQVFIRDTTGTTTLVSQDTGGTAGNGASSQPTISADGRSVAFTSVATLAPTPGGSGAQIFLRDTQNNTTTLVSQDAAGNAGNGASSEASINGNSGFVAFSSAADFFLGATGPIDIFVRAIP